MASTYLSLNIHVVFATKDRAPLIDASWRGDLHAYIGGAARTIGVIPFVVGGVSDHVHVLFGVKATHAIADVVREVKRSSSLWARDRDNRFAWQIGYGAFSVGRTEKDMVTRYIERQEEHHRDLSSAEELRNLLIEHGIGYDERYFE